MASLLRTRMTEDLRIRNYSEKTVSIYVRCVAAFAKYFGRSPEVLDEGHIREYQVYLVKEKKPGRSTTKAFVRCAFCTERL